MSRDGIVGCLTTTGALFASHLLKEVFAPNHYHPHTHPKYVGSEMYDIAPLQVSVKDLLASTATNALLDMRKEVKKALKAYKTKAEDIGAAADKFIEKANAKLNNAHKQISDTVDKYDLMSDIILYQMAQANGGTVSYDSNFYSNVKKQIGRCGLDEVRKEFEGKELKVGDHNSQEKLDLEVTKRLEKLGYDQHEQSEYHDYLLAQTINDNPKVCKKLIGSGSKDAVKHTLIGKFFTAAANFIEELLETGAEIGIALLTGHIVDFDEIDALEEAKLSNDNVVRTKGPHSKPGSAEDALREAAEDLRDSAGSLKGQAFPGLEADWTFDKFAGSGADSDIPTLGELTPYVSAYHGCESAA